MLEQTAFAFQDADFNQTLALIGGAIFYIGFFVWVGYLVWK